jgi:hypothetical protein
MPAKLIHYVTRRTLNKISLFLCNASEHYPRAALTVLSIRFGAVIAREKVGGPAEVEELYNVGLSTINAFGGGWARAFIPLFMTVSPPLAYTQKLTPLTTCNRKMIQNGIRSD